MRYIKKLGAYMRGMRVLILFIVIILTVVMFIGVMSFAYINDALLEYRIVKNNNLKNAYYYARTISYSDLIGKNIDQTIKETYFSIKNDPIVENAYTTIVANYARYNGNVYSVVLYDPELVGAFPGLEKLGITFSGEENECVLSSQDFSNLRVGDRFEAELFFGSEPNRITFIVSSHLVSPYKQMEFGGSGTNLIASDMFSNNPGIIIQADEAAIDQLSHYADIKYYPDVLFTIKDGVSDSDTSALISSLSIEGTVESLDDIIGNTEELIRSSFLRIYIKPLVYLIASLFALFSIVILMVRRKSPEMAIAYLTGASRKSILAQVAGVCFVITVIPTIINIAFVCTAPELNWRGGILGFGIAEEYISSDLIWIVLLYFVLAVIISAAAMAVSMSGKSPLAYLKSLD